METKLTPTRRRLAAERIATERTKRMDATELELFAWETHYASMKRVDDSWLMLALEELELTLEDLQ